MKYFSKSNKKQKSSQKYGFFKAIWMSFYSPDLYLDVFSNWRGLGGKYLLLLISILTLPYSTQAIRHYSGVIEESVFKPLEKLPPFTIYEGKVRFHSDMPYFVHNHEKEVIGIIDTTGTIKRLPHRDYPKASVLVTENAMRLNFQSLDFLLQGDVSEQKEGVIPFGSVGQFAFVGEDMLSFMHIRLVKNLMALALYPAVIALYFSFYAAMLWSLAVIGQLLASQIFKFYISYKEAARLMTVAVTPQAFLYLTCITFDISFSGHRLVSMILLGLYFNYGLLVCRNSRKALAVS